MDDVVTDVKVVKPGGVGWHVFIAFKHIERITRKSSFTVIGEVGDGKGEAIVGIIVFRGGMEGPAVMPGDVAEGESAVVDEVVPVGVVAAVVAILVELRVVVVPEGSGEVPMRSFGVEEAGPTQRDGLQGYPGGHEVVVSRTEVPRSECHLVARSPACFFSKDGCLIEP